jgi:hypothetical protein
MRRAEGKGRIRRESKEAVRGHAAGPARSRKPAQTNAVRDNPLRAGTQQKGDRRVTRPGLTQVQGYLGFPISPDTDNL